MTVAQPLPPAIRIMLALIRHTPLSHGRPRKSILKLVKRYVNYPIITDFRGIPFILNLDNTTEAKALFGHYNLEELAFLKEHTAHDHAIFIDLGANAGFYTQNFLGYGRNRLALAIEPNPDMCQRIKNNYALLRQELPYEGSTLAVVCNAVGEAYKDARLDVSHGWGSANITENKKDNTVPVKMVPLLDIISKYDIKKIDLMKVDIEGYEDRALIPFFEQACPNLYPRHMIVEHTSSDEWAADLLAVLDDKGYVTIRKTRGNLLLSLK
ncbi:MAG: FkbM family methyltransferase [Micavibrio sp.]